VSGSQKQCTTSKQYVKNPQLRTSAFYPLHPEISSVKISCILPVSASADPHLRILPLACIWPATSHNKSRQESSGAA